MELPYLWWEPSSLELLKQFNNLQDTHVMYSIPFGLSRGSLHWPLNRSTAEIERLPASNLRAIILRQCTIEKISAMAWESQELQCSLPCLSSL